MDSLTPQQLQEFLDKATEAALASGKILQQSWGNLKCIQHKSSFSDLVTEVDKDSEDCIIEIIHSAFPDHAVLAEESGAKFNEKSRLMWAIDPLDGTTNYTHQFPMVSISIGLLFDQAPILGVVYNPILNDFFHAAKGLGAFHNGASIKVSGVQELSKSLLVTGFPYMRDTITNRNYLEFARLTQLSQGVRRLGSAALDLAFVAAGRLDGYWERGLKPWDMAAGTAIVHEAGGRVTSCDATPFNIFAGDLLASNGSIHELLREQLDS